LAGAASFTGFFHKAIGGSVKREHFMPQSTSTRAEIAFFAETNFRNRRTRFGIKLPDRRSHMYVIGKTGVGKSTLLETLINHDLNAGHGLILLDPHGDLVERVLAQVPKDRQSDLIYFNVPDTSRRFGFNPLQNVSEAKRPLAAAGMLAVFKSIWADSWGPRLEHILRNALLALLDQPQSTLADVLRLLNDRNFRRSAMSRVGNGQVKDFWLNEYEGYPQRLKAEAIAPVQNKVGAFLSDPVLNRILTQPRSSFRLREVMDGHKVLLVNLAKGKIGEDSARLLGSLLVARIGLAGLSRADTSENDRRDCFVYLDEFHSFTTLSLAQMLSELRKYGVSLVLGHQYLTQIDEQVRDAVLGNVGTMICFRVGPSDAETLAREFYPEFSMTDLTNLPNYHIYLKLMIDGAVSRPFSAQTLAGLSSP
jgi:hypothetical protein